MYVCVMYRRWLCDALLGNHLLHPVQPTMSNFLYFLTDGCELTCPVMEECSSTSYTTVGVGVAGGVVVGLISGIVGTVTVLLVIMRKRASKGMV